MRKLIITSLLLPAIAFAQYSTFGSIPVLVDYRDSSKSTSEYFSYLYSNQTVFRFHKSKKITLKNLNLWQSLVCKESSASLFKCNGLGIDTTTQCKARFNARLKTNFRSVFYRIEYKIFGACSKDYSYFVKLRLISLSCREKLLKGKFKKNKGASCLLWC